MPSLPHRRPWRTTFLALFQTVFPVGVIIGCVIHSFDTPWDNSLLVARTNFRREEVIVNASSTRLRALEIVQRSYNRSFAFLDDFCGNITMTGQPLKWEADDLRNCILSLMEENSEEWPWWFKSMLRDTRSGKLYGGWHHLDVPSPPMSICVMEKVGTKHWRKFQCLLNQNKTVRLGGLPCQTTKAPIGSPKVVFLRDPLERFLSGFLDKCIDKAHRFREPHCTPATVFQGKTPGNLSLGIIGHNRRFFEAFIDTMPVQWDMHFFPQALYCGGLFRTIKHYDYVGYMGPNFYRDLHGMGTRYGQRVDEAIDVVFDAKHLMEAAEKNTGVETSAVTKVQQYYTPKTVRRVLEFLAIDYVALNLSIPEWAEDMLQRDETEQYV